VEGAACTLHYNGGYKYDETENPKKRTPPIVATVRCEILDADMLPPNTASNVQSVCPIDAPTATPIAFLWVASCIMTTENRITSKRQFLTQGHATSSSTQPSTKNKM
jgi:hypothetical protein